MNKLLLLVSFTIIFVSCSGQSAENNKAQSATVEHVNAQEFKELITDPEVQLVDVRTLEEVNRGKIEGARHIDFLKPNFETQVQQLDKTKPVAVYCAVGGRSANAAEMMKSLGFEKVYDLKGGYKAWVRL